MSMDQIRDRKVPFKDAKRMLRLHVTPLTAIALAADHAAANLCNAFYSTRSADRYTSKTRGLLVAVLWTEGVREWALHNQPPSIRVHSPFNWTELLVCNVLHVRVERDQGYPVSERRRGRQQQFVDETLPLLVKQAGPYEVTNVDLVAKADAYGRINRVEWQARMGKGHLWAPRSVPLQPARRLLTSWQRRDVPWLSTSERGLILAQTPSLLRELEAKDAEIERLHQMLRQAHSQPAYGTTLLRRDDPERRTSWTGRPKERPAAEGGSAGDDIT